MSYSVEQMRDILPVLEMFKRPEKHLKYHLESKHIVIATRLEQDINRVGASLVYHQINDLLIGVLFKLKTFYNVWTRGNTQMSDNELREIVLGVNYEIYEIYLHTVSLARLYLPRVQNDEGLWNDVRAALHGYVRRCHIAVPGRFANPVGLTDDIEVPAEERENIIAGRTIPSMNLSLIRDYNLFTPFTHKHLSERLDIVGDTGTVHPAIRNIVGFCAGIEVVTDHLRPDELGVASSQEIQEQLLLILELLMSWDLMTLASLFKDEKLLLEEYHARKGKEEQPLPYQIWRENQLTKLFSPNIVVAETLC